MTISDLSKKGVSYFTDQIIKKMSEVSIDYIFDRCVISDNPEKFKFDNQIETIGNSISVSV